MEYLLMLCIGIIIGMLVIIGNNIKKTRNEEKQFFEEYKELVEKCFDEENTKKKGSK